MNIRVVINALLISSNKNHFYRSSTSSKFYYYIHYLFDNSLKHQSLNIFMCILPAASGASISTLSYFVNSRSGFYDMNFCKSL